MNKPRLLKLAEHLESGELGHDVFDFNIYHDEYECKTSGCAIGECVYLFPEDWHLCLGHPVLRKGYTFCVRNSGMKFFDLTEEEYYFVFTPVGEWNPEGYLPKNATKEEVAAHIRKFVEDESYRPGLLSLDAVKIQDRLTLPE